MPPVKHVIGTFARTELGECQSSWQQRQARFLRPARSRTVSALRRPTVDMADYRRMAALRARLGSPRVLAGLASISGGTIASQAVVVASMLLLTRLYSPESFGIYSYILALAGVAATIATGRLEAAIPLAVTRDRAHLICRVAVAAVSVFTFICALLVAFVGSALDAHSDLPLLPWLWFLPPLTTAIALWGVVTQMLARDRRYRSLAGRSVANGMSTSVGKLVLAWLPGPSGLLAGETAGRLAVVSGFLWTRRGALFVRHPLLGAKTELRRFWRLPAFFAPAAAMNAFGLQLPLLLTASLFGAEAAGALGLASLFTSVPAAVLGTAVTQVFMGEVASRHRQGTGTLRRTYLHASFRLLIVSLPAAAVMLLLPPSFYGLVLGPAWLPVGEYVRAISLAAAAGLIAGPLSQVLFITQSGLATLLLDGFRVVSVLLCGWIASMSGASSVETVFVMYLALATTYGLTWLVGLRVAGAHQGSETK